ncbi:AraC family transcriptional regulator [Thauera sp. SDU_THAU2]|uniref:AraC family transcriptional regulator n=1 Tax=Thauera sp. SDU_THAU2 TaxID=3136633 RepID=UPI00311D3B57
MPLVPNGVRREPVAMQRLRLNRVLRPGLSLNSACDMHDESVSRQATVDEGVRIVMVLDGAIDVAYGGRGLKLAHARGADAGMVVLHEPEECRRVAHRGDWSRRICIGLGHQWLEESFGARADRTPALPAHLEPRLWTASSKARVLAEQLLQPPLMPSMLTGMYLESRAIELVMEAFSRTQAGDCAAPGGPLRPAVHRRMLELRCWLRENAALPLSIDEIARHANTTATTLQRQFRQAMGMTVFDFLQRERLSLARHALERDGLSVAQASELAGYTNPGSFATAFRRQFGLTPRQVRAGL